jgi:hypothetical protein
MLPKFWNTIANISLPDIFNPLRIIPDSLVECMNSYNLESILLLYSPYAVYITAEATIQGISAIRSLCIVRLNGTIKNFQFILSCIEGKGS